MKEQTSSLKYWDTLKHPACFWMTLSRLREKLQMDVCCSTAGRLWSIHQPQQRLSSPVMFAWREAFLCAAAISYVLRIPAYSFLNLKLIRVWVWWLKGQETPTRGTLVQERILHKLPLEVFTSEVVYSSVRLILTVKGTWCWWMWHKHSFYRNKANVKIMTCLS